MNKLVTFVGGIALILLGVIALAGNVLISIFNPGLHWWDAWRLWPLIVLGVGALLAVPAVGALKRPGLGMLFIPAAPILVTGAILMFASFFNQWGAWSVLWPLEVLAVAGGFLLAAIFARNVWLGIPAILIGMNGVVLAFCNTTGLWGAWSVLWTVEPLAVGLVLLLVAAKTRSLVVTIIGLSFCGFSFLAFTGMTALLAFDGLLFRVAGPALLIVLGGGLLLGSFLKRPSIAVPTANDTQG